jgi:hypothetical protein
LLRRYRKLRTGKSFLRFAEPTSDDEKYSKVIDIGKKGESIGDYVLLKAEPIYNLSLSKRVGVARGSHVLVQRRPVSVLKEDRTFAFGKGRITVEGPDILGKPICHPGCHWRNGSL